MNMSKVRAGISRVVTPNKCDGCDALVTDNSLTLYHKKWLCAYCFPKAQRGLIKV